MRKRPFSPVGPRWAATAWLFAAWLGLLGCAREEPKTLTVVYSADLRGAIDPCDCPGKEYGGLARRATFLEAVRDTAENLLLLDAGDFFSREIEFGLEKAEIVVGSMALMGYDGVVPGEADFGFGVDYLLGRAAELNLPVVAANLYDAKTGELLFPPSTMVDFPDGLGVGIIGVMGDRLKLPPQVPAGALQVTDPVAAVEREVAAFAGEADVVIVLAHLPVVEARKLAERVAGVDMVVVGHEGHQPRKTRRFGNAFVLQVPKEGTHAGVAFAVVGKEGGVSGLTADLTPLSDRYKDHEAIAELIRAQGL